MKPPSRLAIARRHLLRAYHRLSPATRRRIAAWECADGVTFLSNLGVTPGNVVLDFGSGPGHYSVPAAAVVGERGLVCAVDRDPSRRRRLTRRALALRMGNVRIVAHVNDVPAALDGRRCDAVLAYDVLHIMDADERRILYGTFKELLADGGLLSVHPKHVRDDAPNRHFQEMTADDVANEIEAAGFRLRERLTCTLWHDHGPMPGTVLNFERAGRQQAGAEA